MTIRMLHYNIELFYDKVASEDKSTLHPAERDVIVEKAIFSWLREQIDTRKGRGVELDETQTQKLSTLIVKPPIDQAAIVPANTNGNVYEFQASDLDYSLYHVLRGTVSITDGTCTKDANVLFVEHDDLHYMLTDSLHAPSLSWGRVLGVVGKASGGTGGKSIYLYSDGNFTITNLSLTYIKYPVIPTIGGYNDILGSPVSEVELDLPAEVHYEIVDKAVELISVSLNDPNTSLYTYNYKNNQ